MSNTSRVQSGIHGLSTIFLPLSVPTGMMNDLRNGIMKLDDEVQCTTEQDSTTENIDVSTPNHAQINSESLSTSHADEGNTSFNAEITNIDTEIRSLYQSILLSTRNLAELSSKRVQKQNQAALCGSLPSPILRLPVELLEEIFKHCLDDGRTDPASAPLLLCHICSAWRTAAFGMPSLWSTLSLSIENQCHASRYIEVPIMKKWLMHSGNVPLALSLQYETYHGVDCNCGLEESLIAHSHRLRKLDLRIMNDYPENLPDLQRFRDLPKGHVEQLECLVLSDYSKIKGNPILVFQSAPRLRKAKIVRHNDVKWFNPVSPSSLLPWKQLTHLEITNYLDLQIWLNLLPHCTLLQFCRLALYESLDDLFQDRELPPTDLIVRTTLKHLSQMTITVGTNTPVDIIFKYFAFPALAVFVIHYNSSSFASVALHQSISSLSHSLRHLSLGGRFSIYPEDLLALFRAHPLLISFHLSLSKYTTSINASWLWDALAFKSVGSDDENADCLLPNLEHLDVQVSQNYRGDCGLLKFENMVKSRWDRVVKSTSQNLGAAVGLQRVSLHCGARMLAHDEITALLDVCISEGLKIDAGGLLPFELEFEW